MINMRRTLVALALAAYLATSASAAEWGSIKGKFVYEGKATNKPVTITQDVKYCSEHKPVEETIVLGKNGALTNVLVYLSVPRGKTVDIHPDYKADDSKPVVLDNKGCRFEPHVLTVWTEQTLEVRNSDPGLAHNTNASAVVMNKAQAFNETVPNDKPLKKKYEKTEPVPTEVKCNVHPWMRAYMLIRENPYMAVSGEDGSFEIKNVPAGKQAFVFWHEADGYMRDLKVGKETANRKGEVNVTVPAGKTVDLGEIKVAPDILGQKG